MCGIAGLIQKKNVSKDVKERFLDSAKLMNHRGPDYMGVYEVDNVFLVHFRLSILDIDPRSHQPFCSASGSNICVYNGELYNYKSIGSKLRVNWRTNSDTEVMLESFEHFGYNILPEWNGIFAAAILNEEQKELSLIRDRLGVKPLYYYEDDTVIVFASESKVILSFLPSFSINYSSLNQYIWFGNPTGSQTIVQNVKKIEPGTITKISLKNYSSSVSKFWNYQEVSPTSKNENDIVEELKVKLSNSVKRQLVSDVPLGILLSGGVDSSGLVAMAAKNSTKSLDTYSVEYDYNIGGASELKNAARIAEMYNTNHNELKVTTSDVKNVLSNLVFQFDQPFADPATVPLYQLAKECSNDKRVILQGDGGDELFAGYSRYNVMRSYSWWKYLSKFYPLLFFDRRKQERLKRLSFILGQENDADIISYYLTVETPYKSPSRIFTSGVQEKIKYHSWNKDYKKLLQPLAGKSKLEKLLICDFSILLQNRYLEKVDKATMLCSVESRVPYLDNEMVDFALSIPAELKIKGNEKKYLLKKALEGSVPHDILYGRKRGFDVPYREWLRKDLYGFFKENITNLKSNLIDQEEVLKILALHKNKTADYGDLLWKVLVLSVWISEYSDKINEG